MLCAPCHVPHCCVPGTMCHMLCDVCCAMFRVPCTMCHLQELCAMCHMLCHVPWAEPRHCATPLPHAAPQVPCAESWVCSLCASHCPSHVRCDTVPRVLHPVPHAVRRCPGAGPCHGQVTHPDDPRPPWALNRAMGQGPPRSLPHRCHHRELWSRGCCRHPGYQYRGASLSPWGQPLARALVALKCRDPRAVPAARRASCPLCPLPAMPASRIYSS